MEVHEDVMCERLWNGCVRHDTGVASASILATALPEAATPLSFRAEQHADSC
jgi:hypothetical protein